MANQLKITREYLSELRTKFLRSGNHYISFCINQLEDDLVFMKDRGVNPGVITKRDQIINEMITFYNVCESIIDDYNNLLQPLKVQNIILENEVEKLAKLDEFLDKKIQHLCQLKDS